MSHTYCFHQELKICFLLIPDSSYQDRYIYFEIKIITFETTPSFGPKVNHHININTFEVNFLQLGVGHYPGTQTFWKACTMSQIDSRGALMM